jgi:hypothetical protein
MRRGRATAIPRPRRSASSAKKQDDHGGSRGKDRLQEPHSGERAVEQPAARDQRALRGAPRRSGFSRGTECDRRLLTLQIRAASAGRASGTKARRGETAQAGSRAADGPARVAGDANLSIGNARLQPQ